MTREQSRQHANEMANKYQSEITLPDARDVLRDRELTADEVDGFVAKLKAFREHTQRDLPTMRQNLATYGHGEYWVKWIDERAADELKKTVDVVQAKIGKAVSFGIDNAKNRSELDIETNKYAFSNAEIHKTNEALFARTLRTIEQATRLEQLLELPPTWASKASELESHVKKYREKVAAATKARGLPMEIGQPEHHKIATEVFTKKSYGVGKVVKQIVNSTPVPRDRIEHKEFAGKLETIVRKWEEFQVTTVEEEDGKTFLYTNNLAKFSRAPNPTPIGKWILKQRFKNGEISKDKLEQSGVEE